MEKIVLIILMVAASLICYEKGKNDAVVRFLEEEERILDALAKRDKGAAASIGETFIKLNDLVLGEEKD